MSSFDVAIPEFRERSARQPWLDRLAEVNRELWLLLSIFAIAAVVNWFLANGHMILGLYALPTLFSAYYYGRRHAVLTALGSILLVIVLLLTHSAPLPDVVSSLGRWIDLTIWGGLMMVTAYAMGTLYEKKESHVRELRRTYFGVLTILQQFISNDKYTHNHSYRVAIYAGAIAARLGVDETTIDDIRAAALLHDLGKLDTSREILYKAASLSPEEMLEMRKHVQKGAAMLEPVGGSFRRILPIILAHHDRYDGGGYRPTKGEDIPVEARVLSVADAYDTLTSDRPYRRAVTPFEAKEAIVKGSKTSFDPKVVQAFVTAFDAREMDIPESVMA
jgi:putative nucleotidyltransferase with HDIG domain